MDHLPYADFKKNYLWNNPDYWNECMQVPRDLMVLALEEKGWETTQKVQEEKEAACPVLSPFLRES